METVKTTETMKKTSNGSTHLEAYLKILNMQNILTHN